MARPPKARSGKEGNVAGRRISAGLAPFRREISPRATAGDLWVSLETTISDPHGFRRLERNHGVRLDKEARLRVRAYLNQARQYYETVAGLAPVAKPLTGYYFALNLTKVYLTVVKPDLTKQPVIGHGLSQAHEPGAYEPGARHSFEHERFKVTSNGVFQHLAKWTGMRHCWPKRYVIGLYELLPYLPEAYDLFADSKEKPPSLLPIADVRALFSRGKEAWLRVEVEKHVLRQRNFSAEGLLERSRPFGDRFSLVSTDEDTYSYESKQTFTYGKKRSEVTAKLAALFDETLVALDRSFPGPRRFLVLSTREKLLSHEAVTFAVLHHLSNVVRYRPADAERILTSHDAWLLTRWVDRACENFLLNLTTRITGLDHVIAG